MSAVATSSEISLAWTQVLQRAIATICPEAAVFVDEGIDGHRRLVVDLPTAPAKTPRTAGASCGAIYHNPRDVFTGASCNQPAGHSHNPDDEGHHAVAFINNGGYQFPHHINWTTRDRSTR